MKTKSTLILLLIITFISCKTDKKEASNLSLQSESHIVNIDSSTLEVIKLKTDKNFRFKGLAIDSLKEIAYLGSWDKKQIVKVSLKDKTHSTIPTKYSGKLNGMGTFLKDHLLYAVMNEVDDDPNIKAISVLLIIDTHSDKVLQAYESIAKSGRNHFNHVVVDSDGVAYISNTLQSSIHSVDTKNPKDSLKIFFQHKDLSFVHGIDLNNNDEKLFTTAYDGGIRFLDIKTKQFYSFRDTTLNANDGLKYYKGDLYGVGKNAIKKYTLNKEENKVIKVDTLLVDHPFFNDPRCLHIQNDLLFCLANIEFEPVTFTGGIGKKRKKALDDTYLIKLKLE